MRVFGAGAPRSRLSSDITPNERSAYTLTTRDGSLRLRQRIILIGGSAEQMETFQGEACMSDT